jgi:hypothetical protein
MVTIAYSTNPASHEEATNAHQHTIDSDKSSASPLRLPSPRTQRPWVVRASTCTWASASPITSAAPSCTTISAVAATSFSSDGGHGMNTMTAAPTVSFSSDSEGGTETNCWRRLGLCCARLCA